MTAPFDRDWDVDTGIAVMLCAVEKRADSVEQTAWSSLAEALEAAHVIPCRKRCAGHHRVVHRDRRGRLRVQSIDEAWAVDPDTEQDGEDNE